MVAGCALRVLGLDTLLLWRIERAWHTATRGYADCTARLQIESSYHQQHQPSLRPTPPQHDRLRCRLVALIVILFCFCSSHTYHRLEKSGDQMKPNETTRNSKYAKQTPRRLVNAQFNSPEYCVFILYIPEELIKIDVRFTGTEYFGRSMFYSVA